MAHTDPLADMFTRIRNASSARHDRCDIPRSNLKVNVAEVLKAEGYISDYQVLQAGPQGLIRVTLKYDSYSEPVLQGISRVSKPGLRKYVGCDDIPKVKSGLGTVVLSTSNGVMTGKAARRSRMGGEVLAYVW